jgi:glycosyltransferase involved in cell wall biosynthesis
VASDDAPARDRLRILIALMYAYPGTSPCANHMQRLARGLVAEGHDALIVAPRATDGLANGVDALGGPFETFHMPRKPRGIPYYPHWIAAMRGRMRDAVHRQLSANAFDAVILMGESGYVFNSVRKAAQTLGVPVFGYPMEWFPPTIAGVLGLSWVDQWLQRVLVYRKCNGIIGISRLWAQFAEQHGIPSTVVPSFSKFADDELPRIVSHDQKRFRVVFVGRWFRRELPPTLFRALDMAIDRGIDLELVVLGSAGKATSTSQAMEERPSLKELERYPRVKGRIRFMGFLVGESLVQQMGSADALVILRHDTRETRGLFPTRLPEFLATGKPVILSDAGDLALYLKHMERAYVIPAGDQPTALADGICFLAAHPDQAMRIGAGGRAASLAQFSQRVLARRVVDFIRDVRRSGGPLTP